MEPNKAAHWVYYVEFIIVPLAAVLMGLLAAGSLGWMIFVPLYCAGLVIWTLLEYGIHRYPLHHWPYFSEQHDYHHRYPKSYVGISSLGVAVLFSLGGYGLALITTPIVSAAVFAGILTTYGQYIYIHHILHHFPIQSFGKHLGGLWQHHAGHHRGGDYNFGVSTVFWDRVFGTKRP